MRPRPAQADMIGLMAAQAKTAVVDVARTSAAVTTLALLSRHHRVTAYELAQRYTRALLI